MRRSLMSTNKFKNSCTLTLNGKQYRGGLQYPSASDITINYSANKNYSVTIAKGTTSIVLDNINNASKFNLQSFSPEIDHMYIYEIIIN